MAVWPLDYLFNFGSNTLGDSSQASSVRGTFSANGVVRGLSEGFVDLLQAAQVALYQGTRSVKKVWVNSTPNTDTSTASPSIADGEARAGTFTADATGDSASLYAATSGVAVTTRKPILGPFPTFAGLTWAIYSFNSGAAGGSGVELVINASWSSGTNLWTQINNAAPSWRLRLLTNATAGLQYAMRVSGSTTWGEGSWSRLAYLDAMGGTGGVRVVGDLTSTKAFYSTSSTPTITNIATGVSGLSITGTDMDGVISFTIGAGYVSGTPFTVDLSSSPSWSVIVPRITPQSTTTAAQIHLFSASGVSSSRWGLGAVNSIPAGSYVIGYGIGGY